MPRLRRPPRARERGFPALASLSQSQQVRDATWVSRRFEDSARARSSSQSQSSLSSTQRLPTRQSSPAAHLLAGAIGGGLSRTATAPIQTVRLRMVSGVMDGSAAQKSLLGEILALSKNEGWRALFKGNLTNVIRFAPTKGLDFFTFSVYKTFIGKRFGIDDTLLVWDNLSSDEKKKRKATRIAQSTAAGAFAGLTSTALLFPLDNLTTRLAVAKGTAGIGVGVLASLPSGGKGNLVSGLLATARLVVKTEGVKGLYRGVSPALLGIAPEAALTYGIFDLLKERCTLRLGERENGEETKTKVGPGAVVVCAAVASLAGQTFAFPMEAISRRLTAGGAGGATAIQVLKQVIAQQGVKGLYRGIGPATIRIVPMAAISFSVYECLVVAFDEALEKKRF